ncbi:MAG TPA: M20/M25/M40 family metallo-hydrolase [Candidatus Ventrousia excrementavium]|uniref:M20/M25/M40 family metallo-hydrolase n=1 Tax=Candidatus Ventrousia excrementavium TaxID=2840961 RepID=A0A9D1IU25_9CLOT|nr:M20/M25/M40 family metallo-hydrolase [Candidatus Ventrousia excrementavium]
MYQTSEQCAQQFKTMTGLPQVQKALELIEQDQDRCIAEQCELVQIEAPTGHEEKRAAVFADKLRALGLEDVHIDRGGNVVALRRGKGKGPRVLIEGHLDTVFPFGSVKGVEQRDGFIYAPGIGDDTRALAMLLSLARAMNEAGIETAGDVVFVGTTREEGTGSLGGMKDFLQDNPDIDISLSIDNNDMSGIVYQATIGETWEVTFSGTGGHAFGAFGTIAQPIHAAARAVAKIADIQVPAEPKTTYCVSNFHGGNDAGVHAIASEAVVKLNFRSNSPEEFEVMKKKIFDAFEQAAREETDRWGKNTIEWSKKLIGSVPGGSQDEHAPLVEAAWLSLEHVGVEPVLAKGGCTNANVAMARGIPALCMGRAYAPDAESKTIYNHSLDERYPVAGAYKAVQQALLVLLMAAGVDGVFGSIVK